MIERRSAGSAAAVVLTLTLVACSRAPEAARPGKAPTRYRALVEEVRPHVREIDVSSVRAREQAGERLLLIDVREDREWEGGRLPGAVHVSRGLLEKEIERLVPDTQQEVVLYCHSGLRSVLAAESLQRMGYQRVSSLTGGWAAWKAAGLPTERADPPSASAQSMHPAGG